jgi:metallo-beta-lactamase family protein
MRRQEHAACHRAPRAGGTFVAAVEAMTRLSFLGAAETVTGSRYLVERDGARVLVDCGLFQGPKRLRERNWRRLAVEPASLDAVVLTHAHIDHSGYLPRLCNDGFTGPVYCTPGTRDLLHILLPDAGFLQEEEARHANLRGYAHHQPALPLYTRADAERCLGQLAAVDFHTRFVAATGIAAQFARAGHILGAATVNLEAGSTVLGFSGDVGRPHDPVMRAPEPLAPCDVLVVESTYGERAHPEVVVEDVLAEIVSDAVTRGGALVVPAFAVGRAQHLLHLLAELRAARRIPGVPIFLDSPMAIDVTDLYRRHAAEHRLSRTACAAMCNVATLTRTVDESMAIGRRDGPMIVISASGMATGGRVLHHLRRFLPDPRSTVLLVGYQAAGTRGHTLASGAYELKLLGGYVPVRAKVATIDALSAHADHRELIAWLRASGLSPREVFVTHGEPAATDAMRRRLVETFGWRATVPELGESYEL